LGQQKYCHYKEDEFREFAAQPHQEKEEKQSCDQFDGSFRNLQPKNV